MHTKKLEQLSALTQELTKSISQELGQDVYFRTLPNNQMEISLKKPKVLLDAEYVYYGADNYLQSYELVSSYSRSLNKMKSVMKDCIENETKEPPIRIADGGPFLRRILELDGNKVTYLSPMGEVEETDIGQLQYHEEIYMMVRSND